MYLLDTVVLSELRKRRRDPKVGRWIESVPDTALFLSAITVAEGEGRIERQRAANPPFAAELASWLDVVLRAYAERALPLTVNLAWRWGRLAAHATHNEIDLAIAATALEHVLVVATRNVSDSRPPVWRQSIPSIPHPRGDDAHARPARCTEAEIPDGRGGAARWPQPLPPSPRHRNSCGRKAPSPTPLLDNMAI
jgi:toxin FitB